MYDVNSRFQFVDQAVRLPGQCLFTKTEKGPFIDTGLTLNKFDSMFAESNAARVYLTVDVVREMAEQAGLFDQVREEMAAAAVQGARQRYDDGVRDGTDLAALADRLGAVADRLLVGAVDPASEASVGAGEADDGPLVFDGSEPLSLVRDGARAVATPGQGDRPGRRRRPAGVPADPGNESFRI